MILNTEQAKRIIKRDIWRSYKKCPYCKKEIDAKDFENMNVGLIKSKLSTIYYHPECYEKSLHENMRHDIEVCFWDEFHENYIEED